MIVLVPTDDGARIKLGNGDSLVLGRNLQTKVTSLRVSRHHCKVTASGDGTTLDVDPIKAVYILRHSEPLQQLRAGQSAQLKAGDRLYLLHQEGKETCGFRVDYDQAPSTAGGSKRHSPTPHHAAFKKPRPAPPPSTSTPATDTDWPLAAPPPHHPSANWDDKNVLSNFAAHTQMPEALMQQLAAHTQAPEAWLQFAAQSQAAAGEQLPPPSTLQPVDSLAKLVALPTLPTTCQQRQQQQQHGHEQKQEQQEQEEQQQQQQQQQQVQEQEQEGQTGLLKQAEQDELQQRRQQEGQQEGQLGGQHGGQEEAHVENQSKKETAGYRADVTPDIDQHQPERQKTAHRRQQQQDGPKQNEKQGLQLQPGVKLQRSRHVHADRQPHAQEASTAAGSKPLFGCHFTFWVRSHMTRLIAKAKEAGAVVEDAVTVGTTHVVARYDTTEEEAEEKLGGCSGLEFSALVSGSAASNRNPLPNGIHFVTPQFLVDCIAQAKRLKEEKYHIYLHKFQRPPGTPTLPTSLPQSFSPPYIIHTSQASHVPAPPLQPPAAEKDASGGQEHMPVPPPSSNATHGFQPVKSPPTSPQAQLSARLEMKNHNATRDTHPDPQDRQVHQAHGYSSHATAQIHPQPDSGHAPNVLQGGPVRADGGPGECEPLGPQQMSEKPQQLSEKGMLIPGPELVCDSCERWGEGERWIEPWDDAAARESVRKLLAHWHRREAVSTTAVATEDADDPDQEHAAPCDPAAGVESSQNDSSSTSGPPSKRQGSSRGRGVKEEGGIVGGAGGTSVSHCHVACSALGGVCIVEELEKVRGSYLSGRRDEFRVKAINRAIRVVEALEVPLQNEAQVAALKLGTKTTVKIGEIITTGSTRRAVAMRGDEREAVMKLLMEIWGVAETTADRWYAQGCRSLDDARQRTDLTETQRLGLKYYNDFLQRIPRREVEECAGIMKELVVEVIREATRLPDEQLMEKLHMRVMGSYLRGKKDCGDIDFIITPPPAAAHLVTPSDVLDLLLQRLLGSRHVTPDSLPPRRVKKDPHHSATWMGVWKGPSSPCHRRIDIKVYPGDMLPFAVNYFGSSRDFCKALRFWCNTPTPEVSELARRHHPAANAFKLNDQGLYVVPGRRMWKKGKGKRGPVPPEADEPLGPSLECKCETDIFRAVGLSYVPPHYREL